MDIIKNLNSINYFCSGFDINDAFWDELAFQLKADLKNTKRIVYIPGSTKEKKLEKAKSIYIPSFTEHFRKIGIEFENVECITPDMSKKEAQRLVLDWNMIFLLGGNQFLQQELEATKYMSDIIGWNWKETFGFFTLGGTGKNLYGNKLALVNAAPETSKART